MRSQLAKFIPDSINCHRIKSEAWNEEKILVLTPEQMIHLSNKEHAVIVDIGNRLYRKPK